MDINALKRTKEKLDEKTGSDGFFNQKNIGTETVVRLLPPSPQLEGLFHMEVKKYWIAGKSYICQSTFGKKSIFQEELDKAKASEDDDLIALATNTDNKTGVSAKTEFWMTLLHIEYKLNKNEQITGYTVIDDKAKVMQCGSQLLSSMIKVATSRKAITAAQGAEDGIADRENGSNMILSKAGKALNTKYDAALDESMEIDSKYYLDIPDVFAIARAQMKNGSYQRAIIRQYLYGEDIPKEVQAKEDARMAEVKEAYKQKAAPIKKKTVADDDDEPVVKKKKVAADDDDDVPAKKKKVVADDDDVPVKKKKVVADDDDEPIVKKKKVVTDDDDDPPVKKKKVVADDDDDPPVKKKKVVDDDDDDAPVAKKKAITSDQKKKILTSDDDDDEPVVKKKKVVDDDDDDPPAKKTAKKKVVDDDDDPPAKKTAGKKKNILDDVDDDDLDDDID